MYFKAKIEKKENRENMGNKWNKNLKRKLSNFGKLFEKENQKNRFSLFKHTKKNILAPFISGKAKSKFKQKPIWQKQEKRNQNVSRYFKKI